MSLTRELQVAIESSRKAAEMIAQRYGNHSEVRYKSPIEPVTDADIIADQILRETISQAFPSHGWMSEETVDSDARLTASYVWIVDPLDGTREFIAGRPEFCVSVGLARDGEPVLGVIINPITGDCFAATRGGGATCNGQPIHVSPAAVPSAFDTLVSRNESRRGEFEAYQNTLSLRAMGGMSHKLVLVARGEADATFTCNPRNEWDIAAGVVILAEAGGVMTRLDGSAIKFNQPSTEIVGLAASNGVNHAGLLEAIDKGVEKS
jgi:myo-inositol-1(or 4)-monophosphatase